MRDEETLQLVEPCKLLASRCVLAWAAHECTRHEVGTPCQGASPGAS